MALNLDNLPKTIELLVSDGKTPDIPLGQPFLRIVDQRFLPNKLVYLNISDWLEAVNAIIDMAVRGAPAIGIAGAAAVCLRSSDFMRESQEIGPSMFLNDMTNAAEVISDARPTAVNLRSAVNKCTDLIYKSVDAGFTPRDVTLQLFDLVNRMIHEDISNNLKMGRAGAALLTGPSKVMTHCNAGSLATAYFGTALGVIYTAAERDQIKMVYADETRPLGQGSRLTAWELSKAGVPVTLICDDMAATVMAKESIDAVFVGADRIASNGDVANKIGTLGLAVLAKHFNVPFYVVAPAETIDFSLSSGGQIPIEHRNPNEVLMTSIEGVGVINPSFDVTPASLVTKIVTEHGVYSPDQLYLLEEFV